MPTKGIFNYNIDHDWTGGILASMILRSLKSVATRSDTTNVQPAAPSTHGSNDHRSRLLGLAFDKLSPYNYLAICDAIFETFDFPNDCQWTDCAYPRRYNAQQTVAIYVQ